MKTSDISISNTCNGYLLATVYMGYRVKHVYSGYTKREAIKLFKHYVETTVN